jgi:hypothetical protein
LQVIIQPCLEAIVLLPLSRKLESLGYGRFANPMGKAIRSSWLNVIVAIIVIVGF